MRGRPHEETRLRALVSFPESHNVYMEALAAAISADRPHTLVRCCVLEEMEEKVKSFDPHVVICSKSNEVDPGDRPAWIEIAIETRELSELCLAGDCSQEINPDLSRVLSIIDELDSLLAIGHRPEGC